ncbi:hypothetical protein BH23CHL8_BH23CHL8_11650 [soil metagenome]
MAALVDREVRLERLHPAEVRAAMDEAAIAWLPLGALELHAEHLPFGTDGFSAQQVAERAARLAGGVVLPWSYLTLGTLHLPWTFRYDAGLVEGMLRHTLRQLAEHGARVVIVHTGHGPLDLIHLIKRVCTEVEGEVPDDGFRAYGLCYGPNPRDRASGELGERQLEACATLLAERARWLLAGERLDVLSDLRDFVARYWPERIELAGRQGAGGGATLVLRNPAPVSRYLTGLEVAIDGRALDPVEVSLVNAKPGEAGHVVRATSLGPESGFYVRRGQSAEVRLPLALAPGRHGVRVELGLAGVTTASVEAEVEVA